jgi:hypothetical protein
LAALSNQPTRTTTPKHEDIAAALGILAAAAFVVFVAWLCWVIVRSARTGKKGFRAFGAALMLFGWGHMRDPRNDTVAEANEGQIRKGETSGDPTRPSPPR